MRVIEFCYHSFYDEPNTYEVVRFPSDAQVSEIEAYGYEAVDIEYGNRRWFSWKEI